MIKFDDVKILVVGDIMLDEYTFGDVRRVSPEAPVPVVWVTEDKPTLGGAGNVVNNLVALGAEVALIGVIGQDYNSGRVMSMLDGLGVDRAGVLTDSDRPTTTKTRIVSSNQQLIRVDREVRTELSRGDANQLVKYIEANRDSFDAVILSDYNKGVLTTYFTKKVIKAMPDKFIAVDPAGHSYLKYKGASIVTPNHLEAEYAANIFINCDKNLRIAGERLTKYVKNALITRGKEGMVLFEDEKEPHYVSTKAKEVYDVSGAGDTVIAVLTLAAASCFSLKEAAELANIAAGIAVGKAGTATVSLEEMEYVQTRH